MTYLPNHIYLTMILNPDFPDRERKTIRLDFDPSTMEYFQETKIKGEILHLSLDLDLTDPS